MILLCLHFSPVWCLDRRHYLHQPWCPHNNRYCHIYWRDKICKHMATEGSLHQEPAMPDKDCKSHTSMKVQPSPTKMYQFRSPCEGKCSQQTAAAGGTPLIGGQIWHWSRACYSYSAIRTFWAHTEHLQEADKLCQKY